MPALTSPFISPLPPTQLHGRRYGRITKGQQRAWQQWRLHYLLQDDFETKTWFRDCNILEIGCGMGEHLLTLTQRHPHTIITGIEVYVPGLAKAMMQLASIKADHVRLLCADAREVVERYEMQLYQVHIYFPDPWPKLRHHKRRLIDRHFLEQLACRVVSGGHLYLATDCAPYAHAMLEILSALPQWENRYPPGFVPHNRVQRAPTRFEQRARSRMVPVFDLHFFRTAS